MTGHRLWVAPLSLTLAMARTVLSGTNVYVVTPLRAMATFQGALQAMGRGLRLPAGRRVANPILDELDVVCFGREKLERIVTEATEWTGATSTSGGGIKITRSDESDSELVPVEVGATPDIAMSCADLEITRRDLNLVLSPEALRSISEAVVTEVDLVAARTRLGVGRLRIPRDRFAHAAALRCIRSMPQFLSDEAHLLPLAAITREWLSQVSPGDGSVEFDPVEVGEEIAVALRRNAKLIAPEYNNTNRERIFTFPSHIGSEEIMLAPGAKAPLKTVADLPVFEPANFKPRQLYRGWNKSVYSANAFDSEPEALLARLLDRADELVWWVRNAPVRLEIDTPAGRYRPDFVTQLAPKEDRAFMVLEAKADFRWEDPLSEPRIKNRAAQEWVARQRALGHRISLAVALESDIRRGGSWSELVPRLR